MHEIQQHILRVLLFSNESKYAQLKPKEVEGNLFTYHLNRLIKDGLVHKTKNAKYSLTARGKRHSSRISLKSMKPRVQPKIVTLIVAKNNAGEYLFFRQKRQPFIDLVGFPYGKIHLGETMHEAAKRELKEKTGLKGKLKLRGSIYSMVYEESELISHILFHVFTAQDLKGKMEVGSVNGVAFWDNFKNIKPYDLIPVTADIIKLLKIPSQFFFKELTFKLR